MTLHDPDLEKHLLHIAKGVAGATGFRKSEKGFWKRILTTAFAYAAALYILVALLAPFLGNVASSVVRDSVIALLVMALVSYGIARIAVSFQKACFFSTLANLPVTGLTALLHIRMLIIRSFWFPSLAGTYIAAWLLYKDSGTAKWINIPITWSLLTAIVWATLIISQDIRVRRLHLVKIWRRVAYCLLGYFYVRSMLGASFSLFPAAQEGAEELIDRIMWLFPPSWVLPGKVSNGGLLPAILLIVWGLWSWLRWPSAAFPEYDKPHDLTAAFGNVGTEDMPHESVSDPASDSDMDQEIMKPGALASPSVTEWVDRLIRAGFTDSDTAAAGVVMSPSRNFTRRANVSMILAPLWLLAAAYGKDLIQGDLGAYIIMGIWGVPIIAVLFWLMPIADPIATAIRPLPVGSTPVPIFSALPIPTRALLRVAFRITAVRTCIAVAIATPFFWALARIYSFPDVADGLLAAIPALGVAWIFSVPALVSNRLDPHMRRKRGILPLVIATLLALISIGLLGILGAFAGIGASYMWASGTADKKYALLLLPAAVGCLLLSAVMSRIIFESMHLALRQRRYDWKSRIR